jgi:hypothetical protein
VQTAAQLQEAAEALQLVAVQLAAEPLVAAAQVPPRLTQLDPAQVRAVVPLQQARAVLRRRLR